MVLRDAEPVGRREIEDIRIAISQKVLRTIQGSIDPPLIPNAGRPAMLGQLLRVNREQDRMAMEHIFGRTCRDNGIEHRSTKVKHPWTNGQVERMNRTIKEATVKRFHYDDHDQLRVHLADFISAYNFGRRLKTLKGLTPYEYVCKIWTAEPERFTLDPIHQMPGLNT